jgi:uncharacterized protein (DUF433 family)
MTTEDLVRADTRVDPRPIVRDPLILGGRWRLDGTTFAIAEIKADHAARPPEGDALYHYEDVTATELEAALAFAFPVVRETQVSVLFGSITVACECGEDTHCRVGDVRTDSVQCICGREWWIRVVAEPKATPRT